jgi:hypothetical protein
MTWTAGTREEAAAGTARPNITRKLMAGTTRIALRVSALVMIPFHNSSLADSGGATISLLPHHTIIWS